jgi:hypothetical protein
MDSTETIHCHVQLGNHIWCWPEHWHYRFAQTITFFLAWGFSSAHSCRLWRSTIHDTRSPVHHFCAEAINRTGSKLLSLAVALVQIAHEMHTAAPYTGCIFLPSDTLKFAEFLCYWTQLYGTFMHHSTHSKICLLPLATHNSVTLCHGVWKIRKCLLSKFFTLLMVFVWKDNIIKSFLFVYHQQEPLRLTVWRNRKFVCDEHAEGCKHSIFVHRKVVSTTKGAITRSPRKV